MKKILYLLWLLAAPLLSCSRSEEPKIPAICDAPAGLVSSAITASGATVSWSVVSGAASYDVDYKTSASSAWINAATGTTAVSVNLTGLSSTTTYDWRVKANCTSGSSGFASA